MCLHLALHIYLNGVPYILQLAGSATLLQLVAGKACTLPPAKAREEEVLGYRQYMASCKFMTRWSKYDYEPPVELWNLWYVYMCILYTYASASHLSTFIRTCTCIKIFNIYIYLWIVPMFCI